MRYVYTYMYRAMMCMCNVYIINLHCTAIGRGQYDGFLPTHYRKYIEIDGAWWWLLLLPPPSPLLLRFVSLFFFFFLFRFAFTTFRTFSFFLLSLPVIRCFFFRSYFRSPNSHSPSDCTQEHPALNENERRHYSKHITTTRHDTTPWNSSAAIICFTQL